MKKLALLTALLILPLSACSSEETNNLAPGNPMEPETIQLFANAIVTSPQTGQINVEDESTTNPANKITNITFTLRGTGGASGNSRNTSAGGEVSFTGVEAGQWVVEQGVTLTNGQTANESYDVTVE